VRGDSKRFFQVLTHLIDNAAKFTEKGGIAVSCRSVPTEAGQVRLIIDVADTGIGMTREQADSLFQTFTQVDGSTTRKFGGTGIGLALSKRLVERMGGRISVSSTPGSGSTFRVDIPFQAGGPGVKTLSGAPGAKTDRPATDGTGSLPTIHSDSAKPVGTSSGDTTPAEASPADTSPVFSMTQENITQVLDQLASLLAEDNKSAISVLEKTYPDLCAVLGRGTIDTLLQQIRDFDFEDALTTLQEARRQSGKSF
jgi:hypothetical protein